jgi:hypothetical protein
MKLYDNVRLDQVDHLLELDVPAEDKNSGGDFYTGNADTTADNTDVAIENRVIGGYENHTDTVEENHDSSKSPNEEKSSSSTSKQSDTAAESITGDTKTLTSELQDQIHEDLSSFLGKRKLSIEEEPDAKRPKFDEKQSELQLIVEALNFFNKDKNIEYALGAVKLSEIENGPDREEWKQSVMKEKNALTGKTTWTGVDYSEIPPGSEILPVVLIFNLKDNGVKKCRAVVLGNQQKVDENLETYSPVISHSTLRYILHIAAIRDYDFSNFDISAAFVNAEVDQPIYCALPDKFVEAGESKYVKLNRALYGLRQAPRLWSRHFTSSLQKLGFKQTEADPGLYHLKGKYGPVYLAIYVDDGIIIGDKRDTEHYRDRILNVFSGRKEPLESKDGVEHLKYVGLEITRDRKARKIWLTQNDLVSKLETRFASYLDVRHKEYCSTGKQTPITKNLTCQSAIADFPIRKIVGGLMYLGQGSRPDLCYCIKELSRFLEKPTKEAARTAIRAVKYVIRTRNFGVCLGNVNDDLPKNHKPVVNAYSDADFASECVHRRSTTGNIVYADGAPIWWKCVLQKSIAVSTCESEYYSAFNCVRYLMHVRKLHHEILGLGEYAVDTAKTEEPFTLRVDNSSALVILKSDLPTNKSKHFEVKVSFVADKVKRGIIDLKWVKSEDNLADPLTKPRPFDALMSMGVQEVHILNDKQGADAV